MSKQISLLKVSVLVGVLSISVPFIAADAVISTPSTPCWSDYIFEGVVNSFRIENTEPCKNTSSGFSCFTVSENFEVLVKNILAMKNHELHDANNPPLREGDVVNLSRKMIETEAFGEIKEKYSGADILFILNNEALMKNNDRSIFYTFPLVAQYGIVTPLSNRDGITCPKKVLDVPSTK